MDSLYVPIMIAAAVALLVWGVASALKGLMNAEKRKLQQRLVAGEKSSGGGASAQLPLSITRTHETTGASAMLVRWQPMDGLHRMVVQAYPNGTVSVFLSIAGFCMFGLFMILLLATNNMVIAGVAGVLG